VKEKREILKGSMRSRVILAETDRICPAAFILLLMRSEMVDMSRGAAGLSLAVLVLHALDCDEGHHFWID
jgi:hypothetical protein